MLPYLTTAQPVRRIRYFIFLKDVLILALTTFGGPQVHLAMFYERLVQKRRYLTEEELLELNALGQVLPGPTSTQTITALGFKIGGPNLAYLTLLIWVLPAVSIMTAAGMGIYYLEKHQLSLQFTRFIQPMAVGFMVVAGYRIGQKVIKDRITLTLALIATLVAYLFRSPFMTPVRDSGWRPGHGSHLPETRTNGKRAPACAVGKLFSLAGCIHRAALLGAYTQLLPVRLFENFYRNGSFVFGGGQVLTPMLYNEFVAFKHYLTREEFLSGLGLVQAMPGPVFSFASYIGALSMRSMGIQGQFWGSLVSTAGIFLPGTFLIFFVYRFWEQLKRYRVVRASLSGINAASTGLTAAAAIALFEPMAPYWPSVFVVVAYDYHAAVHPDTALRPDSDRIGCGRGAITYFPN